MRHIGAAGLAAAILVGACTGGDDDAAPQPRPGDGVQLEVEVPDTTDLSDAVLPGLVEGEISFADYEGRPVVVNFFASTCTPCVREMPALESVKQELGDRVAFVGVATNDPVDDALGIVEETGVTWDLARDATGEFMIAVGGLFLPTTLVVQPDGAIADVHVGEISADELRDLLREHAGVDTS